MSIVYNGKVIAELTKILELDQYKGRPVIAFEMPRHPETDPQDFFDLGRILVDNIKIMQISVNGKIKASEIDYVSPPTVNENCCVNHVKSSRLSVEYFLESYKKLADAIDTTNEKI
jgi:hypothetical protein